MSRFSTRVTLAISFGVGVAIMLPLLVFIPLTEIYTRYLWYGQDDAFPPFVQFPLIFNLTRSLLLAGAVFLGFFNWRNCLQVGFAFWTGAISVPTLMIAFDPQNSQGQFGWLAVVILALLHAFFIFWPVFVGISVGAVMGALTSRWNPAASRQSQISEPPVSPGPG